MLLNFPPDPYIGERYSGWTWDGIKWYCTFRKPTPMDFPDHPVIGERVGNWYWDGEKWACGAPPEPPPVGPELVYRAYRQSTDATSFAYNNVYVGPASPERMIVIVVANYNFDNWASTLSSFTINGVPLTQGFWGAGARSGGGVFYLNVPNGDTINVAGSFSARSSPSFYIYSITGIGSTTPVDVKGATDANGITLIGAAGGVAIGGAFTVGNQSRFDYWTGLAYDDFVTWTSSGTIVAYSEAASLQYVPNNSLFVNATRFSGSGFMTTCGIAFR
jgi:hypothetical protein